MVLPVVTELGESTELRSHHLASSDSPTDTSPVLHNLTNHYDPWSLLSPPH